MSKLSDLTGKRFGSLTVLEREKPKNGKTIWKCRCDCGNEIDVLASNLVRGNTKSCGCMKNEYISFANSMDITGKRFGKLTAIERKESYISPKGKKCSVWLCKCDCGREKEISLTALRNGQKSCGCSAFDFAKEKIIHNEYTIDEQGIVHVVLRTKDEMLCDIEDWERLKDLTWTKDRWGYATSSTKEKMEKFHIDVMGKKKGYVIDHINRNKLDNRKSNLRFVTKSGNAANSKMFKNNTSGAKGVVQAKSGRWVARLTLNGKNIYLGTYDTFEQAIDARKKGEEKYFKPLFDK